MKSKLRPAAGSGGSENQAAGREAQNKHSLRTVGRALSGCGVKLLDKATVASPGGCCLSAMMPEEETQADPVPGADRSLTTGLRGTVYRKRKKSLRAPEELSLNVTIKVQRLL
jgi:hypothetical protein